MTKELSRDIDVAQRIEASLGDVPVWDSERQTLIWVDIANRVVHQWNPATARDEAITVDALVGAAVPWKPGHLALAAADGFGDLDLASGSFEVFASLPKPDRPSLMKDIGLLISNTGAFLPGAFLQLDRSRLKRMVQLNVIAHMDVAHHFGKRLAARGRGGLLLAASTTGLQGIPFSAEYAAAKAFVLNLGEALHVELEKVGVHVTALLPGAVDTPMLTDFGFDLIDTPMKPMPPAQCVAEGLAALKMNHATHIAGA